MKHQKAPGSPKARGPVAKAPSVPPSVPTDERRRSVAHATLNPIISAAVTIERAKRGVAFTTQKGQPGETADVRTLVDALTARVETMQAGDLKRAESMLLAQAYALDALFHNLAARSLANMGEYVNAADTYMRLALRCQNQSRATLETLVLVKNPPQVAFVRQANIAHGSQQVNNGPPRPTAEASRARESENPPNKLLEQQHGEWLDSGTVQAAGSGDTSLETVGALDGSEDNGRQGARGP